MSYIGRKIQHFRVLDFLAKGGMGDVYVAYDERLQRKVALKTLRDEHRPNAEVKARLVREGRILSQLDHPHICRIYELLEEGEADVLVLELIDGESLKQSLKKKRLDEAQKMDAAIQIAETLGAAHGQGVIHRDLKPDNVMLTPAGDVKVLDFGLSRTSDDDATMTLAGPQALEDLEDAAARRREERFRRLKTQLGRIMGTAAFMSPEQAQGEAATAASDIYSLGLLLHELFTGESPYEPNLSLTMMLTKVSRAETFPATGLDPDLTALIERCKSLAPASRPSAIDVGERLVWIRDKPRRRRLRALWAAATAFLVLVALALGFQAYRIGREAERANREAKRANQEAEAARQVSHFLVDLFELSSPEKARGDTITAREILDGGAEKISTELAGQPLIQARLMDAIGTVYGKLGFFDEAVPLVDQALGHRVELLGSGHAETAESQTHLAYIYWQQGRFDDAVPLYERSIATRERELGADHPDLAESLNGLGIVYWNQGRYDEAEVLYERALGIREKALGPEHPLVAASLDNLAIVYKDQQREDEAEPLYQRSLEIREKALGTDHPQVATSLNNLGVLYMEQKRFAEARPLYERALAIWTKAMGREHPAVGVATFNLAIIQDELGDLERSHELYDEARAIFEGSVGPDHPYVGYVMAGRGTVLRKEGRWAEAEASLRRALAIMDGSLGPEHVDAGRWLRELARVYSGLGDDVRAEEFLGRARKILEKTLGADHPEVVEGL